MRGTKGAGFARSHRFDGRAGHKSSGPDKCSSGRRCQYESCRRRPVQRHHWIARDWASHRRPFQRHHCISHDWASRRHVCQRHNWTARDWASRRRPFQRHHWLARDWASWRRPFQRHHWIAHDWASRRRPFQRHHGIARDWASRRRSCESHCGNTIRQTSWRNPVSIHHTISRRQPHPTHQRQSCTGQTNHDQCSAKNNHALDQQSRAADQQSGFAVAQARATDQQSCAADDPSCAANQQSGGADYPPCAADTSRCAVNKQYRAHQRLPSLILRLGWRLGLRLGSEFRLGIFPVNALAPMSLRNCAPSNRIFATAS